MSKVTGTKSKERTWASLIRQADPDIEAQKRNEIEYKFSNGREFRGNPAKRGAYAPEED
jgi:hypothetical protein